jgi:hypothetical protein
VKRCGVCGREFPDSHKYCEQDASPLKPPRTWRRSALAAALGIAGLAAVAVAGPPRIRSYFGSHMSLEITNVTRELDLTLRVHNRTPLTPALRSLQLECTAGSIDAVALEWRPQEPESAALAISANAATEITVKVRPQLDAASLGTISIGSILGGLSSGGAVNCKGPAVFSLGGLTFNQNLDFNKRFLDP